MQNQLKYMIFNAPLTDSRLKTLNFLIVFRSK